jgi:hypothetical protein
MTTMEGDLTRLRQLVTDLTLELLDNGGTSPRATCDLIAEDAPDLWTRFGRARILSLCEEVQYSELPEDSARLQELFRTFNQKYFGGALPDFAICAVYDANFWQDSKSGEQSPGFVDFEREMIIIGYTGRGFGPTMLLHFMIHAAHPEWCATNCQEEPFLAEQERLRGLGAPVEFPSPDPGKF